MIYHRRMIQVICALLYNCHVTGFYEGEIYQGSTKGICVPGLNCYSCPGAVGACPLGSLQNALILSKYRLPYYVLGVLLLFGTLLGRVVCGFLCPFGLVQDLLDKIPLPKIKKNVWTRRLSWLKYAILAILVILVPIVLGEPGFCKLLCPAGTLEAGIPLTAANPELRELTGALFRWKVIILVFLIGAGIFLFRPFCRFLCPLGAFYSLFHKVSVLGVTVDVEKCTGCGRCTHHCRMDVRQVGDRECIQCGACIKECETGAIRWKYSCFVHAIPGGDKNLLK